MFDNTKHVAPMELKEFQKEAVAEVSDAVAKALSETGSNRTNKIVLHAPTGSGKTVMLSQILSRVARESVTLVLTPGAGSLEQQTFRSLAKNLRTDEALSVRQLSLELLSQQPTPGLIVVANWESLTTRNKKTGNYTTRATRDGEQLNLFDFLSAAANADLDLIVAIDEAHYGASKDALAIKNFLEDVRSTLAVAGGKPFVTLEASATPKLKMDVRYTYEVPRQKVIAEGLMRKRGLLNAGVDAVLANSDDVMEVEDALLEGAWRKRQELADLYNKAGSAYSPLLAVQIPNSKPGTEAQTRVEAFFAKKGVTYENGKLAIFTSGMKSDSLTDIASPDSIIQVLIYKQAISTGWDCPRAQILVGFRHIKSVVFTTQNIGRFSRTTEGRHYPLELDALNQFYVYSNLGSLGVDTTADEKGASSGEPMLVEQPVQSHLDKTDFEKYNLPFSVFRRTKQDDIPSSLVNRAVRDALEPVKSQISLEKEVGEFLSEGVISNETGELSQMRVINKKVSSSSMTEWEKLRSEILDVVRSKGTHGNDGRLAEAIGRSVLSNLRRGVAHKSPDEILGAAVVPAALEIIRTQVAKMLDLPLFATQREVVSAKEEDPIPATTRELRFLGSLALPESVPTKRAHDNRVMSDLVKYSLYALPSLDPDAEVEAYWQEKLSGPERRFEKSLVEMSRLSEGTGEGLKLVWIHKNAPDNNGDNLSLGLSIKVREDGTTKVANFFPDYVMVMEKADGTRFPIIVEIKDDTKVGKEDAVTAAKVRAAKTYSEHTGLPFVVLSNRGDSQEFSVLDTDGDTLVGGQTFTSLLSHLDENPPQVRTFDPTVATKGTEFAEGFEWMADLGL